MEDFIYVLALIAWVIFAFYRKSQKKAATAREAQQRPEPQEEYTPMPTLEEILLGKEQAPEWKPATVPGTFNTDGTPPVFAETDFEREYNLKGITSIEEMDKPFVMKESRASDIQDDKVLMEKETVEDWRNRVDLRQAVIYSEILNRPYV